MRTLLVILGISTLCTVMQTAAQTAIDSSLVMSDGVHIETTLSLPPDSLRPAGGFPTVVFIHGLGGNKDDIGLINTIITANGFGSFTYSVRGQGTSGGLSTIMGPRELQDLREIITYLRTCSGVDPNALGVAGGSQGGVHAWMAAIDHLPGVQCIATLLAPPSYASDLAPNNCVKQQLQAELTLSSVRFDPYRDRIRSFVLTENLDSIRTFTKERDLAAFVDSVRIPVIQSLGWKDVLFPVNGAIRARAQLTARGIPIWSYFGTNGHSEPVNVPEYLFVVQGMLDWFHHWLSAPLLTDVTTPWVTYADDSPGWPHRLTGVWPPAPASTLRLYPHALAPGLEGDGTLQTTPGSGSFSFSMTYDPTYTPQRGWNEAYSGTAFVSAFRSKPVRFHSPLVTDTLDITGIPYAHMYLQGDGGPFQANVRLFDVSYGTGGAETWTLLTHMPLGIPPAGALIAGMRDAEGEAFSHKIPPGHSIGIEINALDMFDANRAHIIPYFRSTSAVMSAAGPASGITWFDIPVVGSAHFVTSVAARTAEVPTTIVLHQNYPNPFNPSTTIRFDLPTAGPVRLEVFAVTGQHVATLLDGVMPAGAHVIPFQARDLASGVYYYRLSTANGGAVRSMTLIR